MIKKLIYILLILPVYLSGQNNFFWSHAQAIDLDLDFQAYYTATAGVDSFNVEASTRSEYINTGIKYYDTYSTTVDPASDATGTKTFSSYPALETIYKNFMNSSPYYSVWVSGVNNATSTDTITIFTDIYFEQGKTVNIGIIGDNYFSITLNSVLKVQSESLSETANFTYCNIFPVTVSAGNNRFSFSGLGDGTIAQTLGVIIWDNTKDQLYTNPVSRSNWNVLWSSNDAIDSEVYTCPSSEYSYDETIEECVKISQIDDWDTGDDVYVTMYVPAKFQAGINSWTLKDGSNNTLDSGSGYQANTVIDGLGAGDNIFKYEINYNGMIFSYIDTITLSGSWDYSGTLTVGYLEWYGSDYYGWISSVYGSINPATIQVSGFSATTGVYYNDTAGELHVEDNSGKKSCNTIEIDGVSYSGFNSNGILAVGSNPFPAEGETCTIKLK